ncbi:hypothetical protein JW948_11890 [bacterium]|nr:hypothetical protein [bacterium]
MKNVDVYFRGFLYCVLAVMLALSGSLWSQLTSVAITPSNRTVNQTAIHKFDFITSQPIPANGRIVLAYNAAFNLTGVNTVSSSTMDGTFLISFAGSNVILTRTGGTAQAAGMEDIQISLVRNPTTATTYIYEVRTQQSDGTLIEDGACSDFIYAGDLHHFTFSGVPATATAGSGLSSNITVVARDEFNNRKTTFTGPITWAHNDPNPSTAVPVDDGTGWSNGDKVFNGSGFIFYTAGSRTLTAQSGLISNTTSSISVGPGSVANFALTCGSSQTAGAPFTLSVGSAVDSWGNSWSGQVNIAVTSGGGNSPNGTPPTVPSQITVTAGAGSNTAVVLTNKVITQFQGTANSVVRYTSPILVNAASLSSFSLSAGSPVTAGIGFPLQVSTAVDNYGNGWTGTINVDASSGGGNAPDGTPPSFNPVVVSDGSGSSQQTLTRTQSTVLRGQSGGVSATTISLLVNPGSLHSFAISGTPATVTAGVNFSQDIYVTVYDPFGNIKTNYNGQAHFSSTDAQAQLTYHSGNPYTFSGGEVTFPGSAFQLRTAGSQTLTLTDTAPNPDVSAVSQSIYVQTAALTQFTMTCGTAQIAGQPFPVQIGSALDAYGNGWSGTVNISATQGGNNSPNGASPSFNPVFVINGSGQSNQMLVCAETGVTLQAQVGALTHTQANIGVTAGSLSSIKIRDAGGGLGNEVVNRSMSVGEGLTVFASGYDLYGNYRQDESSDWSSTGGLVPQIVTENAPFVTFAPTAPGTGIIIAASDASPGISDYTGTITVQSGALHHFSITQSNEDEIRTKIKDYPFTIRVSARDATNNVVSGFTGSVQLTDLTGKVEPQTLGPFENGVWIGSVTITQVFLNNRLSVVTGTGQTGQSNNFDVVVGPGSLITQFQAVQADSMTPLSTITTGQERDWYVKMGVENVGSVALRLDSVRLAMTVNGIRRSDYTISYPTQFRGNGTNLLPGGMVDSLLIRIDVSGANAGSMTLEGSLYLKNIEDGKTFSPDDASTSLTVQTPAEISIQKVQLSRQEVTRGQQVPWQVSMIIYNAGESEVLINSNSLLTGISFSLGSTWQIGWPENLAGGDWILAGKETDSLLYNISHTADNAVGNCQIQAFLSAQERNTLRSITRNASASQPLLIEEGPSLRIISVTNLAENAPRVNIGQAYQLRVMVENAGGDDILDVNLDFLSSGSILPSSYHIGSLSGGGQESVLINATAGSTPTASDIIWVSGTGVAENTSFPLFSEDPVDDSTRVIVQNRAQFEVVNVMPTETQLLGGRVDEWKVKVLIRNPKSNPAQEQGRLVLRQPSSTDLRFSIDGVVQEDYTVIAPAALARGGLSLAGGTSDTLIYRITTTGRQGGTVTITADLTASDANQSTRMLNAVGSGTITVSAEKKLRIISTSVETAHMVSNVGYVNTEQGFEIVVSVENGMGQSIRNIRVGLSSNGQSAVADSNYRWISFLSPSVSDTVRFQITAPVQPMLAGEIFTASILSAKYQLSGLTVPPGPAIDSTVTVIVQTPAELHLSMTSDRPQDHTFSTNQQFSVTAIVQNAGNADIDDSGILRIYWPSQYQLVSKADTVHLGSNSTAVWQFRSPSAPLTALPVSVDWYRRPRDKNSNQEAYIPGDEVSETIYVKTISSQIYTSLDISSPPGAADKTLSTDQVFTVRAIVQWNNVRDMVSSLTLPYGYTTASKKDQPVNFESPAKMDTVSWLVQAPSWESGLDSITVITSGYDAIQPQVPVYEYSLSPLVVNTVARAALGLSMSIIDPPDATDGSLSPGQTFTIKATVMNTGNADTLGATVVSVGPLPAGYSTPDGLLEKQLVNGSVQWKITAPLITSAHAGKIEGKIVQLPKDENTNQDAYVLPNQGSYTIPVTTESYLLAVGQEPMSPWVDASLVPGQKKVKMIILNLDNRGIRGGNHIVLNSIKFDIEDRFGEPLAPADVLSRVYVVNNEDTLEVYGSSIEIPTDFYPVSVPFTRKLSIPVDGNPQLAILADIADPVRARYFQLNIRDHSYISATDSDSNYPVPVTSLTEEDLADLRSSAKYIYDPNTESNLWCSPNPFGQSDKPYTTIRYYLKESGDVTFYIYTLVGDLVWTLSLKDGDSRATAGPHTLTWDGKNDNGRMILNGVYLMFMKTEQGVEGKFKIAVVK